MFQNLPSFDDVTDTGQDQGMSTELAWAVHESRATFKDERYRVQVRAQGSKWVVEIRHIDGTNQEPAARAEGTANNHDQAKERAAEATEMLLAQLKPPARFDAIATTLDLPEPTGTPEIRRS